MEHTLKTLETFASQSQEIGELIKALCKVQPKLRPPKKNKTATIPTSKKTYSYMYADLGEIIESYRLPMAEEGLIVITQLCVDKIIVKICHVSGQWMGSIAPISAAQAIKDFGSMITYNRRYLTEGLIGLAAQEDVDASTQNGWDDEEDYAIDRSNQSRNQPSQPQYQAPKVQSKDLPKPIHSNPSLPPQAKPNPPTQYSPEVQPIVDEIKAMIGDGKISQTEVAEIVAEFKKPAVELTKAEWKMIYDRVFKD